MTFQAPRFACEGASSQATLDRFMAGAQIHFGLSSIHMLASAHSSSGSAPRATGSGRDVDPAPQAQFEAITDEFAEQFFMAHRGDRRAHLEIARLTEELAACRAEARKLAYDVDQLERSGRAA